MNILILTGSPRPHGNSNTLADRFAAGAEAAGHTVVRLDAAQAGVHPCVACEHCHNGEGVCVFHDGFDAIRKALGEADAVVFASPVYYFGLSPQLTAVLSRFYACGEEAKAPKQAALLVTLADTAVATAEAAVLQFRKTAAYLGWAIAGELVAPGLYGPEEAKGSPFAEQAYALGKNL